MLNFRKHKQNLYLHHQDMLFPQLEYQPISKLHDLGNELKKRKMNFYS